MKVNSCSWHTNHIITLKCQNIKLLASANAFPFLSGFTSVCIVTHNQRAWFCWNAHNCCCKDTKKKLAREAAEVEDAHIFAQLCFKEGPCPSPAYANTLRRTENSKSHLTAADVDGEELACRHWALLGSTGSASLVQDYSCINVVFWIKKANKQKQLKCKNTDTAKELSENCTTFFTA